MHTSVLIKMNQVLQMTVVRTVTIGEVKSAVTIAAECTYALLPQRVLVDERRPASGTKILCIQRFSGMKTRFADRNTGEIR